ncbi:MAG: hypothetical protein J6C85_00555 [Alphaproteobacteria bacterium]|nr:hypothetical protein [Alphaproteobacteria bacterium]
MKKFLLAAVFGVCVGVGAALADGNESMKKAVHAQVLQEMALMDENKDGLVGDEEFLRYRMKLYEAEQKKVFAEIDRDGDKAFSAMDLENFYNEKFQLIVNTFKEFGKKIKQE